MFFKVNDKNSILNNIILLENNSLKDEIKELSNINYQNYDYILGKITIKNLYQSNSFFITSASEVANNSPVINNQGLIGLYSNNILIPTNNLDLSIKINDVNGTLKNGVITISQSDYHIGDKVYTSGLTNIPSNILVGTINHIYKSTNGFEDNISIDFIENNSTYVGILTNYA
jgi:cell shape-determining protein MreC